MSKQHHTPCKTCPFTCKVSPGELGNSPPEVYVAQHFLPMKVPCHERYPEDLEIKPGDDSWKDEVLAGHDCVGFAMCRNARGVDTVMPDEMFTQQHDPSTNAFGDIWDFWAHHEQVSREQALRDLYPQKIMELCQKEWNRFGVRVIQAGSLDMSQVVSIVSQTILVTWTEAIRDYLTLKIVEQDLETNEANKT